MQDIFALDLLAKELIRSRHEQAAHDALAAQVPRPAVPHPVRAVRLRMANGLHALAVRLDPCAASGALIATAPSR